ncbi:hypothetical protein SBBP2_120002 [Burkholderiales bacterium]|nr:hypothetical protein SBBP2_120002 [Burkholderiales bacterium]
MNPHAGRSSFLSITGNLRLHPKRSQPHVFDELYNRRRLPFELDSACPKGVRQAQGRKHANCCCALGSNVFAYIDLARGIDPLAGLIFSLLGKQESLIHVRTQELGHGGASSRTVALRRRILLTKQARKCLLSQ